MDPAHKEALAQGREEARIVRRYLQAIEERPSRRGPKRTPDKIKAKIAEIDATLDNGDVNPLKRAQLVQQRLDLETELERLENTSDFTELEDEFKGVVSSYANRKGLSYQAFREVGVPAKVLKEAGVTTAA